ncbi:hypothetical protein ACGFNV_04835 [Streptomyces sp. NPDC048751]|uniref:hypothetical protein n=1 Tax=Streptomyces sp. NPDC048751 TaxID=3365591 RepID=UPI003717338C
MAHPGSDWPRHACSRPGGPGRLVATGEVAAVAYLANPASGSTTGTDLAVDDDTYGPGSRPCETVRKENPP